MNIQSVKSFLSNAAKATTNFGLVVADIYGLENGGNPYMYGVRPAVVGLHAHCWDRVQPQNVAYRALSMPFGEIINSLSPVKTAVRFMARVAGTFTYHLSKDYGPSWLPPALPAVIASAYSVFRTNHFLRHVVPFTLASQFGTIDKKPNMSPGILETFIWFCFLLLSLVPDEEPKKPAPKPGSVADPKGTSATPTVSAKERGAIEGLQRASSPFHKSL
jgi:hypothetical protein